jgi:hypothetical protein
MKKIINKSISRLSILSITALMLVLATGCASSRKAAWEQSGSTASLNEAQSKQYLAEAKKLWVTRHVKADLESALSKFEAISNSDPQNYEVLTYLTRGYYLLADGILQDMDQKKTNWEKSVSWGEKGMAINPEFRKAVLDEKKSVNESVKFLKKEQIDCLYWAAASLGKWAKNSGMMTTLQYKSQIIKMIERVAELQSDYFYGAIHRYWAVYYAVAPGFAGGSMEKSQASFKKAFEIANNYLGNHVLYAENYAVRKGDQEAFKKELNFVLAAKPNVIPELEPEHILEKEKAKRMLATMDQLF